MIANFSYIKILNLLGIKKSYIINKVENQIPYQENICNMNDR